MEAKKAFFLVFVLLILNSLFAAGQDADLQYSEVIFTLKDINSDESIKNCIVNIVFLNLDKGTNIKFTRPITEEIVLSYRLGLGRWGIELSADDPSTPGVDYFFEDTLVIRESGYLNRTIYLVPVGTLEGKVFDSSDNLVGGADLKFQCKSNLDFTYPEKTDRFGAFNAETVPAGKCKILAAYKNLVGEVETDIIQGNVTSATIHLTESLMASGGGIYFVAGIAAILILFFLFRFIRKRKRARKNIKKKKSKKKKEVLKKIPVSPEIKIEETEEGELNPRARDIIKTLNEREQAVVNFLLENRNKGTQANIRNGTGIPKTSLARSFMLLEAKNIVTVETIGRLKKVELTNWFLGKE